MAKNKIIVLGAGLAGLSVAWHLQKKGIECLVFEKESEVGGLCRSKTIKGFTFDCDGHLLHFKHRHAFNLVKSLLGNNLTEHKRSSWVYFDSSYIPYPFQANLHGLPAKIAEECLLGFIEARKKGHLKDKRRVGLLDWINQTFGPGIARHFMVPYNSKFWTLPPENLTCEWLDGFIPVPSLSEIIEGSIEESNREFGYNARFWYPRTGGIGQLPLALAGDLKNIYTGCGAEKVDLLRKEVKITSGGKEKFDYLISTIPLPELPFLIKKMPSGISALFKRLKWNSIFNLNLGLDRKDGHGRHWVYFPQKELSFFRVGFPHNFSSTLTPAGKSSLYVEIAYSRDRPLDKNRIIRKIKRELISMDMLSKDDNIHIQQVNDIKYGYPIYDKDYFYSRREILNFLRKNGIISCGRYGSWRYMSMEGALLDGKKISEAI